MKTSRVAFTTVVSNAKTLRILVVFKMSSSNAKDAHAKYNQWLHNTLSREKEYLSKSTT